MSDINKFTTKEVLNKVLLDSSGNAVNAFSHTTQEAFNAALDNDNSRLNVNLVGGTIGGDVTITGDLTVNGSAEGTYDEIFNGNLIVNHDAAEIAGFKRTNGSNDSAQARIAIGNDTKTAYLGLDGDEKFHIGFTQNLTNNTAFVIDDANNNIGIGTASPDHNLDIVSSGNAEFELTRTSGASIFMQSQSAKGLIGTSSNHSLSFLTNGGTRLTIDTSGNLTISSGSAIQFGDSSYKIIGSTVGNYLRFFTESTQALEINDSQNATFGGAVNIASGLTTTGAVLNLQTNEPSIAANDVLGRINFQAPLEADGADGDARLVGASIHALVTASDFNDTKNTTDLVFSTAVSETASEKMRITSTGNVGIGTVSPVAQGLTVANAGDVNLTLLADSDANGANNWPMIDFRVDNTSGNPEARIYYKQDATSLILATSNTTALTLDSSQNATFAGSIFGPSGFTLNWSSANTRIGGSHSNKNLYFDIDTGGTVFKLDHNSRISLSNNDSGTSNTVFGNIAGDDLASGGSYNSIFGHNAGHAVSTGDYNVAIGFNSLDGSTNAQRVTAIGTATMRANTTADAEGAVAVGYAALNALTSGAENTAIGYNSGLIISTGGENTLLGHSAGKGFDTNSGNTVMGSSAMSGAGDSSYCVAIGMQSLDASLTSGANGAVAVGTSSLSALTSGASNTAVGYQTGNDITIGSNNTILGYQAGATGTHDITGGSNNTLIGMQSKASSANASNQTVIGKGASGVADNSVTLGNADVTAVYMAQDKRATMLSGEIEVAQASDVNAPVAFIRSENSSDYSSSIITVQGDRTTTNNTYNLANFTNAGTAKCVITDGGNLLNTNNSYGAISDEKLKQDIEDANSQWDDIKAVRFRKFKFKDMVEDGFKLGVVAQELEKVSPSLISEAIDRDVDGKDLGTTTKSVKYSILQMKGIVALQEALNRIETLEAKVKELESK